MQSHRRLAKAVREFVDDYLFEDAQVRSGHYIFWT
jgi:hypothetical protein